MPSGSWMTARAVRPTDEVVTCGRGAAEVVVKMRAIMSNVMTKAIVSASRWWDVVGFVGLFARNVDQQSVQCLKVSDEMLCSGGEEWVV